ncbi:MAG TPA: IclR family transcriptional regulator [Actinobacteria bacterium]|nr:IclR family transcriptional regulator [Actinomycetota bacterium]
MTEPPGGLKSVAHALDLLDCFLEDEELGVTDVARRLGVAKSTAHRLLTTLASRGLIEQNPANGRYRLGLHLFELGHLALERIELRRRSKALLEQLREVSGWTVHLSIRQGADSLFLERLVTLRGMQAMERYRRRWPLHATSSGKAICAYDPEGLQARIDAGFPAFTPHTITNERAFRTELDRIRRLGYATSRGDLMPDLASVAAPVLDSHGLAVAAISITGSSSELGEHPDRQARLVQSAAKRLSTLMTQRAPGATPT